MLSSGKRRRNRIRFERRPAEGDGAGNYVGGWDAPIVVAARWAAFRPKFGREQVEAGGLESSFLGTLTVLSDSQTRGVQASDRVVFSAGPYAGTICNIRSIVPTPDNREIEMVIETGVAT